MAKPTPTTLYQRHWYKSITFKLMVIVSGFGLSLLLLVGLVALAFQLNGGARSFIWAEGLWSKAQRDAIAELSTYLKTGSAESFIAFERALDVPLGDHAAREAMDSIPPDEDAAVLGFARGGLPPEDARSMVFLYTHLRHYPALSDAVARWIQADKYIEQLQALGSTVKTLAQQNRLTPAKTAEVEAALHEISLQLIPLEAEFSAILATAARQSHDALLGIIVLLALVLLVAILMYSLRVASEMRRSIVGLRDGAVALMHGDLDYRLVPSGSDEMAELSAAFNRMIASRQRAENELRRLNELQRNVMHNTTNAIYAFDTKGCFTLVNRSLCQMSGYTEAELHGKPYSDLIEPKALADVNKRFTELLSGKGPILNYDVLMLCKDGKPIDITFSTAALTDNGLIVGAAGAAEDVSERKRATARLQAHADELARSNRELEQFAYVASHDLQEPLRSISSFSQLLGKRYKGQLGEEADEYIGFISASVARMKTLLEDLLAFSKVAGGNLKPQPVAMKEVLAAATANLSAALETSGALITRDELPTVCGNKGQLLQLLQNLLGNALKFRSKATPIIHIGVERKGDMLEFSVRDNGIGIPKDAAERIFILFQRLHTLDNYQGNGIGLTICKKIVELHGGRIWVEPDNPGSVFRFTLPVWSNS